MNNKLIYNRDNINNLSLTDLNNLERNISSYLSPVYDFNKTKQYISPPFIDSNEKYQYLDDLNAINDNKMKFE